jgi:regulator of protease activity HflC (stomatin/prohibitin superfamily)
MGFLFFLIFVFSLIGGLALSIKVTEEHGDHSIKFRLLRGVPLFLLSTIFLLLSMSFTKIDAGNVGVVKRFGDPIRQLNPGPHFVRPVADSVTLVTVQTRIVKPSENAVSVDIQLVHVEVTLAYHTDPLYATQVLVKLNDDAETRVITPAILEAIKAITAQYDVKELVAQRQQVRDKIEDIVKARIAPDHIIADSVSITDFSFSQQYEESIEAKVVAEQNAEKADNDLKRIKIQAQQQIAQAEGEAAALKAQKEQITPELLQLRTIEMMKEKWNGQLPENYYGGTAPLPFMDVLAGRQKQK